MYWYKPTNESRTSTNVLMDVELHHQSWEAHVVVEIPLKTSRRTTCKRSFRSTRSLVSVFLMEPSKLSSDKSELQMLVGMWPLLLCCARILGRNMPF